MLSCVGHRVMVPPSAGRRATGVVDDHRRYVCLVLDAPCKDCPWTHSNRLWCSDGPWEKLMAYENTAHPRRAGPRSTA
ncbi:hypothetical protein CJD44_07345 [Streptomyces sp. alain-838]|nr:hypothetical protein CJD44_07345 [Streptomyces sp. alain-838]